MDSTGGGGRGSLVGMNCSCIRILNIMTWYNILSIITWSRGRGCGGGGGEGVELRPSLAPVGGEQGGVGSFGFRDRVDLRGNVFFSS